jgi:hypothetical protein
LQHLGLLRRPVPALKATHEGDPGYAEEGRTQQKEKQQQ